MSLDRKYRRTRITVRFDKAHAPALGIPRDLHRKLTARNALAKFIAAGMRAIGVSTGRVSNFWQGIEALESKPTKKRRKK